MGFWYTTGEYVNWCDLSEMQFSNMDQNPPRKHIALEPVIS